MTLAEKKEKVAKYNEAVKVAKAIYVVSGLQEMMVYLDAKVEREEITEEESDEIVLLATTEYTKMIVAELDKIRNMF